jgi:hypothetical protein
MKTGCAVEAPPFTTVEALRPLIALLSVVAVALRNLRERGRRAGTQELPAGRYVEGDSVAVLSGGRYGEGRALSVREFRLALARLGGYVDRREKRQPGWLVLWRGRTKLHVMVEGARAARRAQRGKRPGRDKGGG